MPRLPAQEIIVIGAGPVGLCCAVAFAQAGHQVCVIDNGARGAGWASGGMLGGVYETLDRDDALTQLAFESLSLWAKLLVQLGTNLTETSVFVATSQAQADALTQLSHNSNSGMAAVAVPDEMNALAAWSCYVDLALKPRCTLVGLKNLCTRAGVTFIQEQVITVHDGAARLSNGAIMRAAHIIIANGQGGSNLASSVPELASIRPVKGQLLAIAHLHHAPLAHVVRAGRLYLIPRDGNIVIGATSQPDQRDPEAIDIAPLHDLYHEACDLWPALKRGTIVESWAGLRPHTPDGLPMIGKSRSQNVWLGCGTYRNGWLLAPAIAQRLLVAMSTNNDASDLLQPFSPQRFPI